MNKKILVVFGTRPEAIKLAPLILLLKKDSYFEVKICVTGQHNQMLYQVLDLFEIVPDYDLGIMRPNQNLYTITSDVIITLKDILEQFSPKYVIVHGDTTTSMAASLATFYYGAKILHIEAGLRTYNKKAPFPEEMSRTIISSLADYHFAPTISAENNLLNENISKDRVIVTGNTVIDALLLMANKEPSEIPNNLDYYIKEKKIKYILVTGHRRENFGEGFLNLCNALLEIVKLRKDINIIFPVHLNPNVRDVVFNLLGNNEKIHLIEPVAYNQFVWLMKNCTLILTDSGGVQEEAPSLGKPVLVTRTVTERPEAVKAGTSIIVGIDKNTIVKEVLRLLDDSEYYLKMTLSHNPYGDGFASQRIIDYLKSI